MGDSSGGIQGSNTSADIASAKYYCLQPASPVPVPVILEYGDAELQAMLSGKARITTTHFGRKKDSDDDLGSFWTYRHANAAAQKQIHCQLN